MRHSVVACRKAVAHLNSLLTDDGEIDKHKRPNGLFPNERDFIRNEIALCRIDFIYWCSRYAFVKNRTSDDLTLFAPYTAQKIVIDIWGQLEELGLAICLIALKARQLGISTLTEMAIAHRVIFKQNVNAIIGSSDPGKSTEMSKMIEVCLANLPWWMLPEQTVSKRGEQIEFGKQNSGISIQHGSQFTGIGRGTTPSTVHLCVSPQTLVRTTDCRIAPITELERGDKVLIANGQLAEVRNVWKSPRTNELTSDIWLWGDFAPLSCTRDHLVLTPTGYKQARELSSGDYVSYPIRPIGGAEKKLSLFRRMVFQKGTKRSGRHPTTKPVEFTLNRDFGWMLGLYLAEGSLVRNGRIKNGATASGMCFAIHHNEVDTFKARLAKVFESHSITSVRRTTSKTATLAINFSTLAKWIEENFGYTDSKRIPDWVWDSGEEFCKGLIEGYLDGDGHIKPASNELYATSIRISLLIGLRELVASLGCGWSSIYFKKSGVYYGRNCQDAWIWCSAGESAAKLRKLLGWSSEKAEPALHFKYSQDGKYIEIAVERACDGFSEEFWDIEVSDPSHSFVTLQCAVHNSECASFINPAELIDASLMGAFHESIDRFMVLESTAEGNTGWWYDTWEHAKETWPRTLLRPVFLPWFVGNDLYPTPAQMRRNPIPLDWQPAKLTELHKSKAELYVRTNKDLCKYLGADWTMPREQMWWWECERENYLRKKELNLFLQEYPADDEEAFQSTNISAFDVDLVSQLREETRSQPPIAVFSITGGSVSPRLMADNRDIDYKLAKDLTIPITARWNKSVLPVNFELVPLKFRSYQEDPLGRLYVWSLPQKNTRYVIGVDTSDGIGQDRAVIQVVRLRSAFDPYDYDEQVAEFASDNVNSRDLWPLCLAVGTWYTTPVNNKFEQIRQVIECNGNGESVQYELRKLGWWNFHPWEHYDNKRAQQSNKIGWYTNSRTRQMAVDTLISSLRDGWLKIHSPWFVKEMQTFERNEGRQSLRAAFGAHDDRLMPLSFAMCSTYIHEITTDGRSFFAAQRKRQHDIDNQVNGVRPSEQTALLMKELGQQRGTPYSGKYSPY